MDTDPDPSEKDLKISCKGTRGEVYQSLVVQTDGFRLELLSARVEITKGLVTITPVALASKTPVTEPRPPGSFVPLVATR